MAENRKNDTTTAKKRKETNLPYLVSVDVGFGILKRVSNAFNGPIAIPSAVVSGVKPTAGRFFGLRSIDEGSLIVTTEDGTFFVGEQAMNIPTNVSKRTQERNRARDEKSRVLFQTGVALSVPHEDGEYDVFIVTGVPNEDYQLSVHEELAEFLNNSFEVTFHLNAETSITKRINVVGTEIYMQPEGTVTYDQFRFDPEHGLVASENAKRFLGVIDIGHYTTDFGLFQDGVCLNSTTMNGSTIGVTEVYKLLRIALIQKFDSMGFRFEPTDQDLDDAIRTNKIFYAGQTHDVSNEVSQSAQIVAKDITQTVLDAWGNETNRLEDILITGGGANVLADYMAQEFEGRRRRSFNIISEPQFGNVLGFYLMGCIRLALEYDLDTKTVYETYILPVFEGE